MNPCVITIANNGRVFEAPRDEIILDSALRLGIALPHQCRGASCGTCKARLSEGSVDHGWGLGLAISDAEKADGYCLLCQARPTSDRLTLRTVQPLADADAPDAVRTVEATVVGNAPVSTRVRHLVLALDTDADADLVWPAGSYAELHLPGIAPHRVYSFASAPSPDRLADFYIALHPQGRASTHVHRHLRIGDRLRLRAPFGACRMPAGPGPVLCIAGGTGIAPILAILDEAFAQGFDAPVHLLFSLRDAGDVFALDRLHALRARHAGFSFDLTLTEVAAPIGRHAQPVPELLPRLYADLSRHRLIVAGAPGMVDACVAAALALRADAARIATDRYVPQAVDHSLGEPAPTP